jgi:hypothetical protein
MNVLGLVAIAAACMLLLALVYEVSFRWSRRRTNT